MDKSLKIVGTLTLILLLTATLVISAEEDLSIDNIVKLLQEADKSIEAGQTAEGLETLSLAKSMLNRKIADLGGTSTTSDLEREINDLQSQINTLKTGKSSLGLKIAYVNVTQAFTAFTDAVQNERSKVSSIKEELLKLRSQAIQEEITEEEYNHQNDILQAKKLRAQYEIELAMVDEMVNSKGFNSINEKLQDLRDQVRPIVDEIEQTLLRMRENSAIPEEVSRILSQANSQYEQLDSIVTNLIKAKIVQVTQQQAQKGGYDLVLKQQNVVLTSNKNTIYDLTDQTKKVLAELLAN